MKRTIATIAAALICLISCLSTAAIAEDEIASSAGKSPLMLNYFPKKGVFISDTGYSEIETKYSFSSSSRTNTLKNIVQRFRYGITDQTEVSVTQAYAISEEDVNFLGTREYSEIGEFHNPMFGLEHRLSISDSKKIYSVGLNVRPEVSYSGYQKWGQQQQIFGKLSWLIDGDIWVGIQGKYKIFQQVLPTANNEEISLEINASKSWNEISAFVSLDLFKPSKYSMSSHFTAPNSYLIIDSGVSPKIISAVSYNFGNRFYGILDYSWQSVTRNVTSIVMDVNQRSFEYTMKMQTITARLVKEF
jgi:hypothetical protein